MELLSSFDSYWNERAELASRVVHISTEKEIRKRTFSYISNPESNSSKVFLPKLSKHAGENLNCQQIANVIIDSFNSSVNEGNLSGKENLILMATLDLYAEVLTDDKWVALEVRNMVSRSVEQDFQKRKQL
jgi:hypothetical protein